MSSILLCHLAALGSPTPTTSASGQNSSTFAAESLDSTIRIRRRTLPVTHTGPVPPVIRVLVDEALISPPFVTRADDGSYTGFNVELLRDCALAVGSRIEFVHKDPSETVAKAMELGRADILPLVFRGDPRLGILSPGTPLLHISPGIWIRRGTSVSTDLDTLARTSSTALNDGPSARWLASQGIQPSKAVETRRQALRLLADGKVKVLYAGHAVMIGEVETLQLTDRLTYLNISTEERIGAVSFGYTPASENAAFWLNAGLGVVGESGRYAEHYRRFIAIRPDLSDQAIAGEAVYYSSVAGGGHQPGQTLLLGVSDRGRVLDFVFDPQKNTGLAIDLGLAIGRVLGRPVEFVNLSQDSPSDAVARGVVHATVLTPTNETSSDAVDQLQPVLTLRGTLVMRKGERAPRTIEELKQLHIGMTWQSGGHRYAVSVGHPKMTPVQSGQAAIALLVDRRVDAVLMLAAGKRNLEKSGSFDANLEEHPLPDQGYVSNEVISVRRGNSLLARDISNALATLQTSGEFDRIYDRWLGDIEPRQKELDWTVIYATVGGLLVAIAIGVAWIMTLREALARRTAQVRLIEGHTAMLASALPVLMFTYDVRTDGSRSPVHTPSNFKDWQRRFPSIAALDRPYEHTLRSAIHPEDVEAYDAAASRARVTLSTFDIEFRLRDADGRYRWLHSIAVPRRVPGGVAWDSLLIDIDEGRSLARAASSSMSRFSVLVKHAPHAAIQFYDLQGRVTAWNDASTRLYGWTAEEATGQSIGALMLREEEAEKFRHEIQRLATGGASGAPVELQFRTKSGGTGTLVSSVFALPNPEGGDPTEFVCMDIDITELRRVEERERVARAQLAMAMDASSIGTWSTTLRDDMVVADARVLEMFGVTDRATPGVPTDNRNLLMNIAPEDVPAVAKAWNDAIDSVGQYACTFRVRVDGRETWISGRGKAYPGPDGRAERIVGISVDITELKRAQLEREQLIVALERSKRLEALGLLAAGVAHDFNNILTAISGYSAMIEHNLDDRESTLDHLHAIESSTNQAALLIRQLIARPARDRAALSGTDVMNVVRECVAVATARPNGRVGCVVQAAPGAEQLQVQADRAQIQQIVLNLIINAAEAAEIAHGRSSAGRPAVDVTLHRRDLTDDGHLISTLSGPLDPGTYLEIDVADNGPGIDGPTQQKIFEPYFSTKVTGRGLGLSVVVSTVHALGGAIKVSSTTGQGTTFRVLVPASPLEAVLPATQELSQMVSQVEAKPVRETHVLVVDDDKLVHDVIVRGLRAVGLRVTSFHNGLDAVAWLASPALLPTDRPRVALIDLSMPGLDGIETLRRLRQTIPGLSAVVMSGYASEHVTVELASMGNAQFLQKPFKLGDLQEVVRNSANAATPS